MLPAPTPENEDERISALQKLRILDTVPDPVLDGLTRCLARAVSAPVALVSLVDTDRQWFLCRVGLGATQTPRDISFCGHAICGTTPFLVENALADERFMDNPLVTGPSNVRAYLGIPLISRDRFAIGSFCAIDTEPRPWTPDQVAAAADLAKAVLSILDTRVFKSELSDSFESLAKICRPRGVTMAA